VLIAAGANVEARNWEGKTPLMAAAIYGHSAALDALLEAGASPFARCQAGQTARLYAGMSGNHHLAARLSGVESQDLQWIEPPLIDATCTSCGGSFFYYADGAEVQPFDGRDAYGQTYMCNRCGRKARFRDELD
jgi:hypothetical protein